MDKAKEPPPEVLATLTPFARATTALALITDKAIRSLTEALAAHLPAAEAQRTTKQLVSTAEASCWANSVACWVEATDADGVRVLREHDMAWPEWMVHGYHVRIERRGAMRGRSGRRTAFNYQMSLFDPYDLPDMAQVPHVGVDEAFNVTGTMVHDRDGVLTGVCFHAIMDDEDLWQFTIHTAQVADLVRAWGVDDAWVRLARTPGVWAAGYAATQDVADKAKREVEAEATVTPIATTASTTGEGVEVPGAVARRVAPGANPVLPPRKLPTPHTGEQGTGDHNADAV